VTTSRSQTIARRPTPLRRAGARRSPSCLATRRVVHTTAHDGAANDYLRIEKDSVKYLQKKEKMKKIDVREFFCLFEDELDSFKDEMIVRNFSKRNQKQWFKLMGDYLGFSSPELDIDTDDDDEDVLFEKAKKRPVVGEFF